MPDSQEGFPRWMLVAGVVSILLVVGRCPRDSADTELSRTTREAVKMAHDAQSDDQSAVLWTGRFRLLGLIMGVSVPIVVAYLIWRSSTRSEIDAVEIIAEAERYALMDRTLQPAPNLPPDSSQPVPGTGPTDTASSNMPST